MFTEVFLSNLAKEFYIELSKNNFKTPKKRFEEFINENNIENKYNDIEIEIINYFNNDNILKRFITASYSEIENIKSEFTSKNWNQTITNNPNFRDKLLELFSYKEFRNGKKSSWLAQKLGIKTCLYCNAQYAFSVGNSITFTFDHFYPKSIYPYLSLSFYNLIPCCDYCNRKKSAGEKELYYPYLENHHKNYKISITTDSLINFVNSSFKKENELEIKVNINKNDNKIDNLNNIIKIEHIYDAHKDIIAELIWKKEVYTSEYKKELEDILEEKSLDKEINRFITSNYTNEEDFHKRPLSKLTHDIAEELGLI